MAFDVYRSVGKQMMVTPTSLLALVLLDEPSGAMTWEQIFENSVKVLEFCRNFNVPLSEKLSKDKELKSIKRALNLLVENGKVELIKNEKLKKDYYSIADENRSDLLYFKNTILHHFIVPYIISAAWVNVFNGQIKTLEELKSFLLQQRKQLKYEFYLPTVKELMTLGLQIVSHYIGRDIKSLEDAMDLSAHELYKIIDSIGVFSRGFNYLFEAYYISAATLKHLGKEPFTRDVFLKDSKEIFNLELKHGRFIKYPESYAQPILKNSLDFFLNQKLLDKETGAGLKVVNAKLIDQQMETFAKHLVDLLTINLKAHSD
jgi:glycerol-3-phosphate O-acyltransferase